MSVQKWAMREQDRLRSAIFRGKKTIVLLESNHEIDHRITRMKLSS